ncbi:hypothetical protein C0J52_23043 [Blattella germanica]|nr:hypothetical protein C0J52_23043 [Blattella germanica]
MVGIEDKRAFCVLDYHVHPSVIAVQRHFQTRFGEDPTSGPSICKWNSDFKARGCICKRKTSELPAVKTQSATIVQHRFRTQYGKELPNRPTIYSHGNNHFVRTGCSVTFHPHKAEAVVEQVRYSFARSPRKSMRHASRETHISQPTIWCILRRRLHLKSYRLVVGD